MKIKDNIVALKSGEKLKIFSPTAKDAQALADHYNTIISETDYIMSAPEDGLTTAERQLKWIENCLNSKKDFIIAACLNNKIIGLGNFNCSSKHSRSMHRYNLGISVQKAYWGKGVASQIMDIMIKYAKSLEIEQIELEVVSENMSARNLYKKFGFIETGTIPKAMKLLDGRYYDFIYMVKDLR